MSTAIAEGCGELCVLDDTGDTKLIWDRSKQDEVDAAKAMFTTLKKKGYFAYSVVDNGENGEVVTEFDPTAERIIMAPQLQGG